MGDSHQIQFNNYLVEFIQKLQKIVPEKKKLLSKYYKYYRTFVEQNKRVEFIEEFVRYLSKYNKEFSVCDEGLFSEDESYYPNKPIQLMKGIDFKMIWHSDNLMDGSKESIWKYLQTLYLVGTFVLKETDRYNELLKNQQEIIYNLFQSLKYEKQIKNDAEKLNQKEDNSSFDLSGLGDLFNEDNVIVQIAVEIAKEINLSGGSSDPLQAIGLLLGQDSNKLQDVITKVSQKLTNVLKDKGLTENELMEQAKKMHDKILNKLKNVPGMPNIEKLSQTLTESLEKCSQQQQQQHENGGKEELEKCQVVIQELTENLKKNLSQLGGVDLNEFQKNINSMMTQMSDKTKE